MHIKVDSEDELLELARTLLHYGVNLRYWQKEWNERHGGILLERKKYWEKKWDDLIEQLGAEKTQLQAEVHISINNTNTDSNEKIDP